MCLSDITGFIWWYIAQSVIPTSWKQYLGGHSISPPLNAVCYSPTTVEHERLCKSSKYSLQFCKIRWEIKQSWFVLAIFKQPFHAHNDSQDYLLPLFPELYISPHYRIVKTQRQWPHYIGEHTFQQWCNNTCAMGFAIMQMATEKLWIYSTILILFYKIARSI